MIINWMYTTYLQMVGNLLAEFVQSFRAVAQMVTVSGISTVWPICEFLHKTVEHKPWNFIISLQQEGQICCQLLVTPVRLQMFGN